MKYLIESYGCQMNIAESNALELLLKDRGAEAVSEADSADAVIINTCSVRKSAENRIWGRLSLFSHIKKTHPDFRIVVTGCMAERMKDDLKKEAPFVDAVFGPNDRSSIVSYLFGEESLRNAKYRFLESHYKDGEVSSYVPIMNGCNNFCSYCIVPYVRGREVSRDPDEIISELECLSKRGVKEVTLLGQNVNSYAYEDLNFPKLLRCIAPSLGSIEFLRFDSPHPKDFTHELIEVIATEDKVAKHIHLPMQSGSNRILRLMNRKNTRESFIELLHEMRRGISNLTFSTDVMVGFPSESEGEYEETLSLLDEMAPLEAFMYYYNVREGTPAEKMPEQIDEGEKQRRLQNLIDLHFKRLAKIKEGRKNQLTKALVVGRTRDDKDRFLCKNEHNEMISLLPKRDHAVGDIVMAQCNGLKGNTYLATEA